ncbi:uncharacterized protein LOC136080352 [Hydra vulgaris]|uniref:Uncharacterized protein LOC136080352 n=1 Tax=Hydra vulgaris TaxID=6087 RepID=A0ABM4BV23_HYDVU
MNELLHRLEKEDSVGGKWLVPVNGKAKLYCDASSIGLGVVLLIGGIIIEDANVSRKEVSAVIASCNQCNSIDPYSVKWKHGQLSVKQNWNRVALDVTHVGAELYLSMIDCGPSRYTVWRKLVTKTAAEIIEKLEEIFSLFGPPVCLLIDNEFRSHTLTRFADKWDVDLEYRAAYRAQGNGIVERIHRSISRTVARSRCSIALVVLLYNETISSNCSKSSSQQFKQKPTSFIPGVDTRKKVEKYGVDNIFKEGDNVWVKPAQETKCDWSRIPGIVRKQNTWSFDVETANRVFPRHISHLHRRIPDSHNKKDSFNDGLDILKDEFGNGKGRYNEDAVRNDCNEQTITRSGRIIRAPQRLDL